MLPPLALVNGCSQVPYLRLRMRLIAVLLSLVSFDTSLFREYPGLVRAGEVGREAPRVAQVNSLLFDAVICELSFRRFDVTITAIRHGSGLQA